MMRFLKIVLIVNFTGVLSLNAQDTVNINLNVKHITEGVSEFDRSKYIVIHDDIDGSEWDSNSQKKEFLEKYDVYFGRNNGGIVWDWNNTRQDAARQGWPDTVYMQTRGKNAINNYASNAFNHQFENRYGNMMIGGQEHMFPHGQQTSIGKMTYSGFEATAEFYAHYLSNFFGKGNTTGKPRPRLLEVINEPFVKADQLGTTREELSRYHNVVAKRVKELNPDVLVGGYSAAHPAFEDGGFNHWRNNWKTFIDIAGENMDFFSFHLYDFSQNTSNKTLDKYRAGSNIEAIMDMINHYSYLKLGKTLPWSVSEYGWLCKECPGGYDQREDWYNIRSFNHMMVQLMERNNQILNAIPFMLLKANWAKPAGAEYNTYGPRVMREIGELPGEPAHSGWIYTDLIKFFELWAHVKGTRIETNSSNPDLMADAYADGKKFYLILSNLEHSPRQVDLNYFTPQLVGVKSVMVKHCYAENDIAKLDTFYHNSPLQKIDIGAQATIIAEFDLNAVLNINQTVNEKIYFADSYFQPISNIQSMNFSIRNIAKSEFGTAVLKLGIGRDHGKSLKPSVTVNGTEIAVPADWRGDDQKKRDSFFGVIDIPVPNQFLQVNNSVTLRWFDSGGYVSSVILQVFNQSAPISQNTEKNTITSTHKISVNADPVMIFPNPAAKELNFRNFNRNAEVKVFNAQGMLMLHKATLSAATLDVSSLPGGFYIMVYHDKNRTESFKFQKL